MKKIHTGVTVWCIFNIGLELVLVILALAVGVDDAIVFILTFLNILFYALSLIPNSFAMIALIILGIISEFYDGGSSALGTWGLVFSILWIFIDILVFFILKYNGKSAFQVSREKNETINSKDVDEEFKKCPFCAELIKKEAIICRFCGRDIKDYENENSSKIENVLEIAEPVNDKEKISPNTEELEKLFDSTEDENEKIEIAKKLYALGKLYYWRFIPREK